MFEIHHELQYSCFTEIVHLWFPPEFRASLENVPVTAWTAESTQLLIIFIFCCEKCAECKQMVSLDL